MEEKVVYIVGLGLIGASLAMGIRKAHPHVTLLEIVGKYEKKPFKMRLLRCISFFW